MVIYMLFLYELFLNLKKHSNVKSIYQFSGILLLMIFTGQKLLF